MIFYHQHLLIIPSLCDCTEVSKLPTEPPGGATGIHTYQVPASNSAEVASSILVLNTIFIQSGVGSGKRESVGKKKIIMYYCSTDLHRDRKLVMGRVLEREREDDPS